MFRAHKVLCLLLLLLGSGQVGAATSAERRAFKVAADGFNLKLWPYAETNFAQFIQKYPGSDLVPEAILFQARSRFQLHQYDRTIALLTANRPLAGGWEDQYWYWIGEASLARGKLNEAAQSFAEVAVRFPSSTNRLAAAVREAEVRARLQQWPQVIELLTMDAGAFRSAVQSGATGEILTGGALLLGEAQLHERDFPGVHEVLGWFAVQHLNPTNAWRRSYLKCRLELAENQTESALKTANEMGELAELAKDAQLMSSSVAMQADILEQLGRLDEAIEAHKKNVAGGMSSESQRVSTLKIAELSLKRNRISEAAETLELFLNQHTNSSASDTALIALGKLRLKQFADDNSVTNQLAAAEDWFDKLLNGFPASPLVGEAWLNKGWCNWLREQYSMALAAFQQASARLPFSEDQAVAQFKWADSLFELKDYSGALTNYVFLVEHFASLPEVKARYLEPALYQTVRAALEARELAAATNALEKILAWYPEGFVGDHALLLTAQGIGRERNPAAARQLFARFQELYPTNALSSEVRLAVIRSFERENNWDGAITNYDGWLESFTNHPERPSVEFARAWLYSRAGKDTNAFGMFTNFVAHYPTHPLALQAQWWIGDYFFQQAKFVEAEENYQLVARSTNGAPSTLTHQAQMMAGRAALARLNHKDALDYFSKLADDTNCALDLRFQATFASGDALMSRTDTDVTNRQADLKDAIGWFNSIAQKYPTNELAPAAWGRMGDCYKDLFAYATNHFYELATNAYQQVLNLPQASVSSRSQAKVGLGIMAEKQAARKEGAEREELFRQALGDYVDVFLEKDLRDTERPDLFWVRESGLKAFRVASEELSDWPQALSICNKLMETFPPLRPAFESRILKAREHLAGGVK